MQSESIDRRALVVTNDLQFRAKLGSLLERAGYTVSLCGTAPWQWWSWEHPMP